MTSNQGMYATDLPRAIGERGCTFHTPLNLGYIQWHAEADRRHKRGERQKQCPHCSHWFWADEVGEP